MKKVMESGNKILPLHRQVEIKNNRELTWKLTI